jgi:threonine/homoserine/homoserine lactone efflux protein
MGICFGFPAMVAAVGLGLGSLFLRFPVMHLSIKIVGIVYLLFLAWKIAQSQQSSNNDIIGKPFTFLQAAAFQWVNPKAWIMAIGAMATYTQIEGDVYQQIGFIVLAFFSVTFPCVAIWLVFGASLQTLLRKTNQRIMFNRVMAILLVISILPMMDFQ